ncbi:hypothetical protein BBJ29_007315 [Phytophthora kernoviae]|uniref:Uncharacterized protein n=1 Tax=Phytophthora kernoviae TaxID=325452 RepID=A0A3R7N6V2_9STRA|nr:hypothetical protein BBJ29_007315 [Phytophthora kernoviae]
MKKQKKCTYAARREEVEELREETNHLTVKLQEQQIRSLSPEDRVLLDPAVRFKVAENHLLASVAKTQQFQVANAQSLLSQGLGVPESHPLYTRICLTSDWDKRRSTLMVLRKQKIRAAYDFLMAPDRFVDPYKTHTSDQRYETAEGDLCSVHLEAVQFPGVKSLQHVWDALHAHYNNFEITIAEQFGHTTIRDDYDFIDGGVQNIRVFSRSEGCTSVESSIITFSQLVTEDDEGFDGQAFGVLALDCVDEDELYPYFPKERVRFDTSGAIVLTARMLRAKGSKQKQEENGTTGSAASNDDDEIVVTLRRGAFLKLHHPEFPVCEATRQGLQAGIGRWGDLMIKNIRSYVYS